MVLTGGMPYVPSTSRPVTTSLQVIDSAKGRGSLDNKKGDHGEVECTVLKADIEKHDRLVQAAWDAIKTCIEDPECDAATLNSLMEGWADSLDSYSDAASEYAKRCGPQPDLVG